MNNNISLQDYKNRNSFLKAFKDDIRSVPEILQDNLEKGLIDQDLYNKALEQYEQLMKAGGEGSRGGKVIGHTKSGYPIYESSKAKYKEHRHRAQIIKDNTKPYSHHNMNAWEKKEWNRKYKEREKHDRAADRILYDHSSIKDIFKESGLERAKRSSTAIRGFNRVSQGYEFSEHNPGNVTLYGVSEEKFDTIVEKMKSQGFNISETSKPSKSIGAGMVSSIKFEKKYQPQDFESDK